MGVPYPRQLADKQAAVARLLAGPVPARAWVEPFHGPERAFRNKAKLVVGGRKGEPTFGILDGEGRGVDLRRCGLHEPGLREALLVLADLVAASGLTPYDVPRRQGELKHLVVTRSPDDELMVRLVLRSPGQLRRVHELLPELLTALPTTRVVSVNLQPEHKAVLEGAEEVVLTADDTLPMRVNGIRLHLRPQSFFQTNTPVAAGLYRQARDWARGEDADEEPRSVVDLYCGVGGFALHLAGEGREVLGVESAPEAVRSARTSADELGLDPARVGFETGDATAYLQEGRTTVPDLVVVNPPRRGIGPLAAQLEASGVRRVLYSSCNARTLADDLAAMPSMQVRRARLFDMFPQTRHHEVLVDLVRRRAPAGRDRRRGGALT